MELQTRLSRILGNIRQRMLQDTGKDWGAAERRLQREFFLQIHTIVSELLSNGYSARIQRSNQSEINLVISSPDGLWKEVIEYQVADYLDVHDQLIRQEFRLKKSSCPTVLSATFDGPQLVLSPLMDHEGDTNVIYGIRCRICDRKLGPCNINYVGQTTRSVHKRVCGEHASAVTRMINLINEETNKSDNHSPHVKTEKEPTRRQKDEHDDNHSPHDKTEQGTPVRPMYDHAVNHFRDGSLPRDTDKDKVKDTKPGKPNPEDVFRLVMDVIILPISPTIINHGHLRSWECFWQLFFLCRTFFYGWSHQ